MSQQIARAILGDGSARQVDSKLPGQQRKGAPFERLGIGDRFRLSKPKFFDLSGDWRDSS